MIKESEKQPSGGNQSLSRGLRLIEILSNYPNGCPLAKLADLSRLSKSTVHRLLQGLCGMGYVTHAPSPGSYRLTAKLVSIGQKALTSLNVIHVAAPHLETLNLDTGETVNFSRREGNSVVLIYKLEPTGNVMRTRAYIGQYMPLYCSAMGKIFLAYGPPGTLKEYWDSQNDITPLTANTIVDYDRMREELDEIRKRGLAMDREENELGVSCIAAPVFDLQGQVHCAVSVSLLTVRLRQSGEEALTCAIRDTAEKISKELGGCEEARGEETKDNVA